MQKIQNLFSSFGDWCFEFVCFLRIAICIFYPALQKSTPTPTGTKYTANHARLCRTTHLLISRIARTLERNAATKPVVMIEESGRRISPDATSTSVSSAAPATAGVSMRNEKSSASLRARPAPRPALIVTPEREMPGMRAKACAQPMSNA